jgi:phenylacetate-CoA ligase
MIRFAPGDETYLATDPCPCGLTYPRLPEGILGRLDDMLVIRGANVFPSAVETGLRTVPELGPEFRILVSTVGALDEITVEAELTPRASADLQDREELVRRIEDALRRSVHIRVPVALLQPGTLPETTFKARRVVDQRPRA